ncbi:Ala-tRNA(Pro) deacylase [Actinopolyspora mzabensis]|uniref:Ala-tRNA(Pro) deacylase n=1 Tax=Actinopolyspora mzabensis TaxID=995066 RepID=A0A1G9FR65_ACTMZ|nr:YbaK/EbsC family protein [Actinopolyspora mzabensis]SDK90825.1 Ala-tRNA(Pro) deacylase [Actinopolyspora mzabensis]
MSEENTTYERLINWLDENDARYELIDHQPEGKTDVVSGYRGHPVEQAAKCIIVMMKLTKKTKRYVLAVVPGNKRVDLSALKGLYGGIYAGFVENATAESLAGSVSGTVLPFAFNGEVELLVDPGMLKHEYIYFNAARLDRSLRLHSDDYERLAAPRVESIAEDEPSHVSEHGGADRQA